MAKFYTQESRKNKGQVLELVHARSGRADVATTGSKTGATR